MIQKDFIVGDKWLYYKIYTGEKTADKILVQVLMPLINKWLKKKIIKKWFFLRYGTPDFHLRIRYELYEASNALAIVQDLKKSLQPFYDNYMVSNIEIDTYKREVIRYGESTMELSEDFFFHCSSLILNYLNKKYSEELRWMFALKLIDVYLNCFGYQDKEKLTLIEKLKNGFGKEFGMSRFLKKQLDFKYRANRDEIDNYINDLARDIELTKVLEKSETEIKRIASKIRMKTNNNTSQLDSLVGSYLHMAIDRLFMSKNRLHELVCYDFLYRHYNSKIKRQYSASDLKE